MHNIIVKNHAVFSYISSPVLPPPLPTPGFKPGSHLCFFLLPRSLHPVMYCFIFFSLKCFLPRPNALSYPKKCVV